MENDIVLALMAIAELGPDGFIYLKQIMLGEMPLSICNDIGANVVTSREDIQVQVICINTKTQ